MDFTTVVDWKSLLNEGNREALVQFLREKKGVQALLDHVSRNGFTACLQDERKILNLLRLIAGNAHWITGELRVVIAIAKRASIGFCTISLWDAQEARAQCLKQIDIPSSFSEIRGIVNNAPQLLQPLSLHQTAKGEMVLTAPKPQPSSHALREIARQQPSVPAAPVSSDRSSPPKQDAVQPPPPALELDLGAELPSSPGRYASVPHQGGSQPSPSLAQPGGQEAEEEDIDNKW